MQRSIAVAVAAIVLSGCGGTQPGKRSVEAIQKNNTYVPARPTWPTRAIRLDEIAFFPGAKVCFASYTYDEAWAKKRLAHATALIAAAGIEREKKKYTPVFVKRKDGSILFPYDKNPEALHDPTTFKAYYMRFGFAGFPWLLDVDDEREGVVVKIDYDRELLDACIQKEDLKRRMQELGYVVVDDPKAADYVVNWQLLSCTDRNYAGKNTPDLLPIDQGFSAFHAYKDSDSLNDFMTGYTWSNFVPYVNDFMAAGVGIAFALLRKGNEIAATHKEWLVVDKKHYDGHGGGVYGFVTGTQERYGNPEKTALHANTRLLVAVTAKKTASSTPTARSLSADECIPSPTEHHRFPDPFKYRFKNPILQYAEELKHGTLGKMGPDEKVNAWRKKKVAEAKALIEAARRDPKAKARLRVLIAQARRARLVPECIVRVAYADGELFGEIGKNGVLARFQK